MRGMANRNAKNATELTELSARKGIDLRPVELDVQSEPSVNAAVERIIAESGRIDVVSVTKRLYPSPKPMVVHEFSPRSRVVLKF